MKNPHAIPADKQDHPIRVDYGLDLPLLINAGAYDDGAKNFPSERGAWTSPDGTVIHYPKNGKVVMHPLLVELKKETTKVIEQVWKARKAEQNQKADEALKLVEDELRDQGLRAANLQELLCFGAVHKELQLNFNIIALGSATLDKKKQICFANLTGRWATILSAGVKEFGGSARILSYSRIGRFVQTPWRFLAIPLPDPWADGPEGPMVVVS